MRLKYLLHLTFPLLLLQYSCSNTEKVTVQKKDLVQGVYASGKVLPVNYYQVTSKVPGIIDSILVDVGQQVKVGTPLLKMQNQPNEMNLNIAKNQFELAKKNARPDSDLLEQLKEQVENAYAAYKQDSVDFKRYKRLQEKNIGTKQDYDRAELRYKTAFHNYQIAINNLQETKDRLDVELKNARSNYIAQQSLTSDYTILSARNGKVYNINPKIGELATSNQPIMEIGAMNHFETELQVDETDIILVKKGQKVVFKLDALEDTVLKGEVKTIYPKVNVVEKTAKVITSIDPLHYQLYPGMSLEANIIIRQKNNVLVLPTGYVTEENEVVLEDNSIRKVETGIRDMEYVEILSGLEEGDIVLKPEL